MRIKDIQGVASIISTATIEVTYLVEEVQDQIIHSPFLPVTPINHDNWILSESKHNDLLGKRAAYKQLKLWFSTL